MAFAIGVALVACTPQIGDKCVLSTDCSLQGNLVCDNAQPEGYCTMINCTGNSCPNNAACVLFNPAVQGCMYSDRDRSRTGRSFCMASCNSDHDCRGGYSCADARLSPWNALILDDKQAQRVCIPTPDDGVIGGPTRAPSDAPVCQPAGPVVSPLDATTALEDAPSGSDAGGDATVMDGGSDATVADAGDAGDAADAGAEDAGVDAADAGEDAPHGGSDAGDGGEDGGDSGDGG
jgi:hypothetical protein